MIRGIGNGGRLGLSNEETQAYPVRIPLPKNRVVVNISCGFLHSAFTTNIGEVFTFGTGEFGQLGHGESISKLLIPKKITGFLETKEVTQVSCGRYHTGVIFLNKKNIC